MENIPTTYCTFWERVCEAIFIDSPEWFDLVKTLPDRVDPKLVLQYAIPYEVITAVAARAEGWVEGEIKRVANPTPYREGDFLHAPSRWAFLQVFGQFQILEGTLHYLMSRGLQGPKEWPTELIDKLIGTTQAAVYFSAYLYLCDFGGITIDPKHMLNDVTVELIRQEIQKITIVLTTKTGDYGQAFLRHGVLGLVYRLWDKIARFATLSTGGHSSKFESKKDTVLDMLGYSVLIWSILEGIKAEHFLGGTRSVKEELAQ